MVPYHAVPPCVIFVRRRLERVASPCHSLAIVFAQDGHPESTVLACLDDGVVLPVNNLLVYRMLLESRLATSSSKVTILK